ncbi:MAG: O-antigen ligase domain-containing protein [Merismopedia sp. SIO2A8]|nr:O-antigen ligase domain-containing protein [Merismopedia sp. SIO2A8]
MIRTTFEHAESKSTDLTSQNAYASQRIQPISLSESVVWYSIVGTYGVYCLGGLYLLSPALGWILLAYALKRQWDHYRQGDSAYPITMHWLLWLWVGGMAVELLALVVGHQNFDLSTTVTIKSAIGWAKGWALLAIFPVIGYCLPIRPQLLYRAACVVALQSLILAPFLYAAYLADLGPLLYTSPLKILGGAGDLFFQVRLYSLDGEGNARWAFFCPWGPAGGMMGNIYFFLALQERNTRWKLVGLAGSFLMVWMSKSRMATLFWLAILLVSWIIPRIRRPKTLFTLGFSSLLGGISAPVIESLTWNYWQDFHATRASSSRVRNVLQRIALRRWWNEAPIWGHGTVDPGPHLVANMPIGSHHTIFGLLFVKGLVGLVAFLIPMISTVVYLLFKSQTRATAATALSIILILCCYTQGEGLDGLVYLFWPGLILVGIALHSEQAEREQEILLKSTQLEGPQLQNT